MFNQVISDYETLEPAGHDTWNPLKFEQELWHRTRLLQQLCYALRKLPLPIEKLRVLDVGSGVGRSTRMLIELGILPDNILAIDVRPSALEYARMMNPAIETLPIKDLDWNFDNPFHLCVQATVFSSILGQEDRLALAKAMTKVLTQDGYIFWWDAKKANDFAGGDTLRPEDYFSISKSLYYNEVPIRPVISESIGVRKRILVAFSRRIQRFIGYPTTHIASLFSPKPM